ncbi:hypothetical protein [Arsenophonus nasoniae]|uniref:Uncharacterized protein n=1 Tax=Arsenophonus nasoniae TaxID=638 RepID=A0A4P7L5X7_9GAMM|nr:hypothetical protein [Arsenophonus nasoniae]QBY46380.1 hypothetical protein ArsFIN_49910 [Arsenophonus nasoniae]
MARTPPERKPVNQAGCPSLHGATALCLSETFYDLSPPEMMMTDRSIL